MGGGAQNPQQQRNQGFGFGYFFIILFLLYTLAPLFVLNRSRKARKRFGLSRFFAHQLLQSRDILKGIRLEQGKLCSQQPWRKQQQPQLTV